MNSKIQLRDKGRIFNYKYFFELRRTIENAFRILAASRFYFAIIYTNPKNVDFMIIICVHNFIMSEKSKIVYNCNRRQYCLSNFFDRKIVKLWMGYLETCVTK